MTAPRYTRSPLALLDIGNSKIACLIVTQNAEGQWQLNGHGYHAAQGIKSGNVVEIDAAGKVIRQAIQGAEHMAGLPIEKALVNLSAGQPTSYHSLQTIPLDGRAASDGDITRALADARKALPDASHIIAHALPIGFNLDGNTEVTEPRGLQGDQLGITVHLVTAQAGPLRTMFGVLHDAQLEASALVLSAYASGLAVLSADEQQLGATVIDMGGGSTSFAMFADGQFLYADRVNIGGQLVTSDLARGLSTPLQHAERIKCLHGQAMASHLDERDLINVPQLGEQLPNGDYTSQQVPKAFLARIIRPRLEETFERLAQKLAAAPALTSATEKRRQHALTHFVLTGGASQLPGVRELAQHILTQHVGRPVTVRYGLPVPLIGMEHFAALPAFATALGLLKFAELQPSGRAAAPQSGLLGKVLHWFKEHG